MFSSVKAIMSTTVPKPPYPKAPITEGVMHPSVARTVSQEELQKLVKRFAKDYSQQDTLSAINVALNTTGAL